MPGKVNPTQCEAVRLTTWCRADLAAHHGRRASDGQPHYDHRRWLVRAVRGAWSALLGRVRWHRSFADLRAQLNVFKPVLAKNLLSSIRLLADGASSFRRHCVVGIEANEKRIAQLLNESLMLATCLNSTLGYDSASGRS